MLYPPTPTTFEDLVQLIPAPGSISKHRFVVTEKPFELQIGRNQMNIELLSLCGVYRIGGSKGRVTKRFSLIEMYKRTW
jgi:hypothetical protein